MKHAYLIIAHSSLFLLEELVRALDDKRNDIYLHLDVKSDIDVSKIHTKYSKFVILSERKDARWGDFSLVEVEYLLLKEAFKEGIYSYYHLISGVDYPIKTQDYIHNFCDANQGKEFIGFATTIDVKTLNWNSQHYFLFSKDFQSNNFLKKILRAIFARLQSLIGFKRTSLEVKKGCQWFSITHDFVQYVIENEKLITKIFNHTYCPDEMVMQTLCWNSDFRKRIYNSHDEFSGCRRYIKWIDGVIQLMDNENLDDMMSSQKWFARKFSDKGFPKILQIKEKLQ